jgi:Txe/YoeB family toxin of Txe-Axe toxin-antitoxin module
MPSAGMPSPSIDGVRSRHIDSNRRVFYEFDETNDTLRMLDIFDLRQNPSKRKY